MYLKSIEVQGFKSFANKITFKFHNGITGIVGPNGSGKSNVADAVRWVLGEQKVKQLRGASMQDVIFSGTEMRKPLGYAYVAITLDNRDHQLAIDYEEVTVARRLYRSGESEYMINNSPCRLKDVYELFYDTGIGMSNAQLIQMCDDFYQADSGSNRFAGGLGLGLPIARGLLHAMGGFIHFDSKEQQGLQAHITIPQGVENSSPAMTLSHPERLCIACYFRTEKYSSDEVRKYYDKMILHMVEGLNIEGYQAHKQIRYR